MSKKRILVVDDEVGLTRLLKLNLEQTGAYEVHVEHDGRRAVETARRVQPDLILLDVIMPALDGGEVAAQLQADPALRPIPIVFLTAVISPEEAGTPHGMIGGYPFLAKPVSLERLCTCIQQHLPSA